jgi:hypothetical protein
MERVRALLAEAKAAARTLDDTERGAAPLGRAGTPRRRAIQHRMHARHLDDTHLRCPAHARPRLAALHAAFVLRHDRSNGHVAVDVQNDAVEVDLDDRVSIFWPASGSAFTMSIMAA